jgi:hypothetical protein
MPRLNDGFMLDKAWSGEKHKSCIIAFCLIKQGAKENAQSQKIKCA